MQPRPTNHVDREKFSYTKPPQKIDGGTNQIATQRQWCSIKRLQITEKHKIIQNKKYQTVTKCIAKYQKDFPKRPLFHDK